MAKIFAKQSEIHQSPNRNNHDLSHRVHLTGKFGVITPFLCMETVPTDVFELDTAIGVNLNPLWYPTQSPMRFIVHYFYVPKRLLMKDWKNYLQGLPDNATGQNEIEYPYLDHENTFYKTGSLADYLNVPTNFQLPTNQYLASCRADTATPNYLPASTITMLTNNISVFSDFKQLSVVYSQLASGNIIAQSNGTLVLPSYLPVTVGSLVDDRFAYKISGTVYNYSTSAASTSVTIYYGYMLVGSYTPISSTDQLAAFGTHILFARAISQQVSAGTINASSSYTINSPRVEMTPGDLDIINQQISFFQKTYGYFYLVPLISVKGTNGNVGFKSTNTWTIQLQFAARTTVEISDVSDACPYYSSHNTTDTVKVSALQFRAYEMIYNSFYRNHHGVQPFQVRGITQYNNYLPTDGNGADNTAYVLHTRNWELDAYTSCLDSPQQGVAPVIAVDSLGRMTITDPDGTRSHVSLEDNRDGSDGVTVTDVDLANPEHAAVMTRIATSGLSIADFRQGNALQNFLEQSLRTGYRYVDFIFGHFGKSPSHAELDMPVFLGGYTQVVDTNKVTNVSASNTQVMLGEYAGTASSFGANKHRIKRYFDDYGYVLGLMTLVPDPAYSSILPKQFIKHGRLDEYFPEFSQLGLQPITYEEICPIQSHAAGNVGEYLTDTFGYQRPYHDLVWHPDTVHGQFRQSLSGSVIQRRFALRPELIDDFLRIHPEECNSIFSVTDKDLDIYSGQVVIRIRAKRPVPAVVIPTLGR